MEQALNLALYHQKENPSLAYDDNDHVIRFVLSGFCEMRGKTWEIQSTNLESI